MTTSTSTMEIELPVGPLLIAFSGTDMPMVTAIASDSPLIEKGVKHGYVATSITLSNNTEFKNLNKEQLVYILLSTMDMPHRKLTMRMEYPQELIVLIPYRDRYCFNIVNANENENDDDENDSDSDDEEEEEVSTKKIMNKPICVASASSNTSNNDIYDSNYYYTTIRTGMIVYGIRYQKSGYVIACSTAEKLTEVLTDPTIQEDRLVILKHPNYPLPEDEEYIRYPYCNDTIHSVVTKNNDDVDEDYYYHEDDEEEYDDDLLPILTMY